MSSPAQPSRVALVTGAAQGLGAGMARWLAGRSWRVVVADVDRAGGTELAAELGGLFVACDVADQAASVAAVAATLDGYGRLDLAVLNAGVTSMPGAKDPLGTDFDAAAYRRVVGINLDGVVYGIAASLPALRTSRGRVVAVASLAGLAGVPLDPVYAATKHAVVGLVRSLGPTLAAEGVRIDAICPSYARTAIIEPYADVLAAGHVPLLDVDDVVGALDAVLASAESGQCWFVVPGRPPAPFRFRNVPGPVPAPG